MYKSIFLKPSYYTTKSDVAEEFYNPVLSKTIQYDRVSGYFSSKALAAYGKGLSKLIISEGKLRLIISHEISEKDFNLINQGYELRKQVIEQLNDSLENELFPEEQLNLSNLSYLIAKGYVDIKIGFKKEGLFHTKFGLCYDADGNIIYFTGSNNETYSAINRNYEAFDITTSWLSSEFDKQKIESAKLEFERLWNNQIDDVFVCEVEEVIKRKIMDFNKGRLIMDLETLSKDALILSIDDNERLIIQNNLVENLVNPKDYAIAKKMRRFYEGEYPNFRNNLSYIDMQNIIDVLTKYAENQCFKFIISNKLKSYIEKCAYQIEERSKYALLIKARDPRILSDFKKFERIVSKEMHRTLREQQVWSAFYMNQMKKSANFSVPGAGKTSMIYGLFAYLNSPAVDKANQIVMIGPKNAFLSWKLEFYENFRGFKDLKVLDIHEEEEAVMQLRLNSASKNLILINYESLAKYESVLTDIINDKTILVFDEVHRIKGIESKRAQVAMRISQKPIYKFVLTGTPIPNSYTDIYNFLNILYQDEYKSFFNFQPEKLKRPTQSDIIKINKKLYPFFWRTNKSQLEVPKANKDEIIKCYMNDQEQRVINLLYSKYGSSPLHLYIRLIQAATNPELLLKSIDLIEMYGEYEEENYLEPLDTDLIKFSEEEINLIRSVPVTTKFKQAIEFTERLNIDNKQTIVWCIFVDTIDKAYEQLKSKGINVAVIYGATPQEERDAIIGSFKRKEIDVLITNPHTLAESVSLHMTCHDAIYLEYSFNLTHMLQSRDRIHRLGLPSGQYTQYYYFMLEGELESQNTIDEKIYTRLKEKEHLMMDAIERDILSPETSNEMDDIVSLFRIE